MWGSGCPEPLVVLPLPCSTSLQLARRAGTPRLTLDEGRGGSPITLHLPAGAAATGLRGHPLPLQDVRGHWDPRWLPVHPEAVLTPGHSPEPSQGLTCVGTTSRDDGRGEHPCCLLGRPPVAQTQLESSGSCWGSSRASGGCGGSDVLLSPFLSSRTTSVTAPLPAAL